MKAKQDINDALVREMAQKSNKIAPVGDSSNGQELTEMKKSLSDTEVSAPKVAVEIETDEDSYYHFVPELVDTSLVNGKIVQVADLAFKTT